MDVKFYLCIKEPERNYQDINMFISYTFYNGNLAFTKENNINDKPMFTLGQIYHTVSFNPDYIADANGNTFTLDEVKEYLVPFDFKIDELTKKVLENKKDDEINISPIMVKDGKETFYSVIVTTYTKNNVRVAAQTIGNDIYYCLKSCYDKLRRRNTNYSNYFDLVVRHRYPRKRWI